MLPIFRFILVALLFANLANAQIKVVTNFEGGNAKTVEIDDQKQLVCLISEYKKNDTQNIWLYAKISGLKKHLPITVRIINSHRAFTPKILRISYNNHDWVAIA